MKKTKSGKMLRGICLLTILLMMGSTLPPQSTVYATTLNLTIQTTKHLYDLGEEITIHGNVTMDDSPFDKGLVAIQIKDPRNNTLFVGTFATGENATDLVDIYFDVFPCDKLGNQKLILKQGEMLRLNATIINNEITSRHILLVASIQFSNNLPFQTFVLYNDTINAGQRWSCNYPLGYIPDDAPLGTARIFGSILSGLPERNGFALCLGKINTFNIESATLSATNLKINSISEPGTFNFSLITSQNGGILGNYTVYASCFYPPWLSTKQITFEVKLFKDINEDGIINMLDLYVVASHYGETPESPNWDPRTDIDKNNIVNMIDLYLVAVDYGKWGQLP